eukprot:scaffold72562_cov27-Tisochrysis_lutea.AAC.1
MGCASAGHQRARCAADEVGYKSHEWPNPTRLTSLFMMPACVLVRSEHTKHPFMLQVRTIDWTFLSNPVHSVCGGGCPRCGARNQA